MGLDLSVFEVGVFVDVFFGNRLVAVIDKLLPFRETAAAIVNLTKTMPVGLVICVEFILGELLAALVEVGVKLITLPVGIGWRSQFLSRQ